MIELQNINIFLNEVRLNAGAIWLNNDIIKFSAPPKFQNSLTDVFIRENKVQIMTILNDNLIFSKEDFQNTIIFKDNTKKYYPLSPAQERMWFIEQYERGTTAYHIPVIYNLDLNIDKEGVKYALQQIVSRHEVLRSTIEQIAGQEGAIQKVHKDPLTIEEAIVCNKEDFDALIKKDLSQTFDLTKEYPIRSKFYTIGFGVDNNERQIFLSVNIHHIASDGWSESIFRRELFSFYEAYINKDLTFCLPKLEIQYKDYALWQKNYLTGDILARQLEYWKTKVSGFHTLELKTDYARPKQLSYSGSTISFRLKKSTSIEIREFALKNDVTLNSVGLSCLAVLLNKYTGQDDVIIGGIIANRHQRQTKDLIGFFTNTQVNRIRLPESYNFLQLIQEIHKDQIDAQLYQDLPFEKLIHELGVERDASMHPVFQVMFTVNGAGYKNIAANITKEYFKPYDAVSAEEVAKFDLTINIDDSEDDLEISISYATSLFKKETIERFGQHYINLLELLPKNFDRQIDEISILKKKELAKILHEWNEKTNYHQLNKTIHRLFEEWSEKIPTAIALVYGNSELSYKELNEKSNSLARYIRTKHLARTGKELQPGTFIALYIDRSIEMIIGILAVLKAGGAYVPIDITYPKERIDFILNDTGAEILLTQRYLNKDFRTRSTHTEIIYTDLIEKLYKEEDNANLPLYNQFTDLAYVIYTSGTTGKPKGVLVEHRQVEAFAIGNNFINYEKSSVVAGVSNYAFDGSIFDIFFTLLNGKKLILINKECLFDLKKLVQNLNQFKVDTVFITTALFNSLTQNQAECFNNLGQVLFGGERCNIELINKFKNHYPSADLVHVYGPTENIVYSTYCPLSNYYTGITAPIGKRLEDKKLYVLDSKLSPVPIGVVGELYIGGPGIARGYLNHPDLTRERFIKNPFATGDDISKGYTRLYKTGDMVRWLDDGNIEYVGRNDDQVKIRGYRIELGEVESAITQIQEIEQAFVISKERKTGTLISKYLVGYYIPKAGNKKLSSSIIIDKLSKNLPDHMIPSALVEMDSFPLTINGKVNKNLLPDPDFGTNETEYIAPTNEIEVSLCNIWKEILGIEKISINDNFFRIGGDSILSIQMASRIRNAGFSCHVKDIFDQKTLAKLAEHLGKKRIEASVKTEQAILEGELDLLPIQTWFVQKINRSELEKPDYFNQSFLVRVPVLDIKKLEVVLAELIAYHDVLRIRYTSGKDSNTGETRWKQFYQQNIKLPKLKCMDVSKHTSEEIHNILTSWQSGFDLLTGPLFQFGYLYGYKDGSARIFFALHHLIVDAVSWRILTDDVKMLYEGKKLPLKGSSYRQWASTVNNYVNKHSSELPFWKLQLNGMQSYKLECNSKELNETFCELDKELTGLLLHKAPKAYHTEVNDLLLTSLAYALKDLNGKNIQGITVEGHGREDIDTTIDHSHTVGWFTTMFPARLEIKATLKESIQSIKESLRRIPNKGIGFGAFATSKGSGFTFEDLPSIGFNYLGQFEVQHGNWQIVSEDSGREIDHFSANYNMININGMVNNGKLGFNIVTKLEADVTKTFSNNFNKHLTKIITHCVEKIENKESSYTPSDFKSVRISQSLLDKLQSKEN